MKKPVKCYFLPPGRKILLSSTVTRTITPITTNMLIIPTARYSKLLTKFIGSKFTVTAPYIKKLRIRPPAMTEAI